jgi:hypothetical protein
MQSKAYEKVFPETKIGLDGWVLNTGLIEYAGHTGSFRNTTVAGSINGMELHFGLVDDPVKGRAEANSKVSRDKVWNWFTDDFFPRFADGLPTGARSVPSGPPTGPILGRRPCHQRGCSDSGASAARIPAAAARLRQNPVRQNCCRRT